MIILRRRLFVVLVSVILALSVIQSLPMAGGVQAQAATSTRLVAGTQFQASTPNCVHCRKNFSARTQHGCTRQRAIGINSKATGVK